MLYTFTEKELECFINWAWPAECEIGLNEFEVQLRDKLRKILNKTFDEMTNSEKIHDFMWKCGYRVCCNGEDFILYKEGKEEKRISYDMDYKEAVKEIVMYFSEDSTDV